MTPTYKSLVCLLSTTFVVGIAACGKDEAHSDLPMLGGGSDSLGTETVDSGVKTGRGPTGQAVSNGAFLAKVIVESHAPKYGAGSARSVGIPTALTFSLSLHELNGQRRVLISDSSSASSSLLNDSQPNLVNATDKLFLGSAESAGCRGVGPVAYHRFELWVNAQGKIEGLAEGDLTIVEGDTGQAHTFKGRIETEADNVSPELYLNRSPTFGSGFKTSEEFNPTILHPFDGVRITASESLRAFERVFLQASDGTELNLMATEGGGPTNRSFYLPVPGLRPDETYSLKFSPAATDMAGNPVLNTIVFGTSSLPIYDTDDFETNRPRSMQGFLLTPSKGDSQPNLPAIAGQVSLVMLPGSPAQTRRFAMQLPLKPTSKRVSMKVRRVDDVSTNSFYGLNIMLFTAKNKFSVFLWPESASSPPPRLFGVPLTLGPIIDVMLPLPEEATTEVMLAIETIPLLGCGLFPLQPGLMVDDIKTE